jgi:signal transduction histidine kinase
LRIANCELRIAGPESRLRSIRNPKSEIRNVVVEVSDTGPGIAPEHLDRIMEPFFTTKPEGRGTGLGMAICKRIVQEHHGTLAVESEVGQGTTVRIVLPAANGRNGRLLEEE